MTEVTAQRVYVAADFARAADAEQLAARLRAAGVIVVSSWHATIEAAELASAGKVGGPPADAARNAAIRNLTELRDADTLLLLTTGELARGGRHFETGYAHALRKRIVIVGAVEHAFHHLDGIERAESADHVLGLLQS